MYSFPFFVLQEKYFTLQVLNDRIVGFNYGYSEVKNVPRVLDTEHIVSSSGKLSQSGIMFVKPYAALLTLICITKHHRYG